MFEGFTRTEIKTSGARIVTVHGGSGPPLLLMHGNPFSHVSWHKVAPRLADEFTVVATDLRGYGDSEKPPGGEDHSGYSFRAMAQDQVEVMAALGFERFYAAGHDRGARVLHRMCLDHPDKVARAAILDIIPQHYLLNNVTRQWGTVLLALVLHDPALRLSGTADGRRSRLFHREEARQDRAGAELLRSRRRSPNTSAVSAIPRPSTPCARIIAPPMASTSTWTSEDFAAGRKIGCPLLLLWGATGGVGRNHEIHGDLAALCGGYPRRQGAALRALSFRGSAGRNLSRASRVLHGGRLEGSRGFCR